MGRDDLIGSGKHQLVPVWQPTGFAQPERPVRGKRFLTQHTGLPPQKNNPALRRDALVPRAHDCMDAGGRAMPGVIAEDAQERRSREPLRGGKHRSQDVESDHPRQTRRRSRTGRPWPAALALPIGDTPNDISDAIETRPTPPARPSCLSRSGAVEEYKCAFNATLMGDQFGCTHARHVVRRGGPDVACADNTGHERCRRLFGLLKTSALPAFGDGIEPRAAVQGSTGCGFGVEDDLLSMPHSTLVKIQFGGLLGIQRLLGNGGEDAPSLARPSARSHRRNRDGYRLPRGPR